MDLENRASPRLSTAVPIGLRFPTGTVREGWGRIVSINAAGLLLETRFPMKVASVVYVTFSVKEGARFENLRAHVIRVSCEDGYYSAGIAFDEVVDKQTLRDVLSTLAYEGGVALS